MTYSRRQLEAFGEPFGESATRTKPGGRIYGGGGQPAPAKQEISQTSIPDYAKPYVEKMLGKAEALTNAPYQAYGGERIAGFTPMQQQAFQSVQNLQPSQQLGVATRMAGGAGLGALNAGQNYVSQATNPNAMGAYMSPYIQNALAPQMEELRRQSGISGQQNAARAVMSGAFGGSGASLQEAERLRNLASQQSQVYGKGIQDAYQQAQQSMQFGSTLGLQGMGQAAQAAAQLGQLGQTQFNQQLGAINAQSAAGAQQQQLEQSRLQQQYQDFLNQRGYQQQQLGWFSDMLRGLPLAQQSQTMYQAPPSAISQIAGLGLAGYGMFGNPQAPGTQRAADGGLMEDDSTPGLGELALQSVMKKKA
jgi:hypothetical protein